MPNGTDQKELPTKRCPLAGCKFNEPQRYEGDYCPTHRTTYEIYKQCPDANCPNSTPYWTYDEFCPECACPLDNAPWP
jgi:hypothetical protein